MASMMVTIDKAGRVVIPKEIRDSLDLVAGTELEIDVERGTIQLERRRQPGRQLAWSEDGRPYFPAVGGHATTDADVQQLRDALHR